MATPWPSTMRPMQGGEPMVMSPIPPDTTTSIVQTLVLYALAEHQGGHARHLRVTAHGRSFSVEDDGRGHAIRREIDGAPYLNFIYGHLDYPHEEGQAKPVQLQGLGMSLLNRLCDELIVQVRKPAATLEMRFHLGRLQSHTLTETANPQTGNRVAGTVHADFSPLPADEGTLTRWLQRVAVTAPSLQLQFNGQALPRTVDTNEGAP